MAPALDLTPVTLDCLPQLPFRTDPPCLSSRASLPVNRALGEFDLALRFPQAGKRLFALGRSAVSGWGKRERRWCRGPFRHDIEDANAAVAAWRHGVDVF